MLFPLLLTFFELSAQADTLLLSFTNPVYQHLHNQDTLVLECNGLVLVGVDDIAVSGGCGGTKISFRENAYVLPEPVNGLLSVMTCTFEAIDNCQHVGELTVHVALYDRIAPLLQDVPADIRLESEASIPSPAAVYAIDNCSRNLQVQYDQQIVVTTVDERYIRTWSAVDEAGNTAEAQQLILRPIENTEQTTTSPCEEFQPFFTDDISALTENCSRIKLVCLGLGDGDEVTYQLNGYPTAGIESCSYYEITEYEANSLFGDDDEGPFEVTWKVGDGAFRERVVDIPELISFLEIMEPSTTWKFDPPSGKVFSAANTRFGVLSATSASSKTTRSVQPVRAQREEGIALGLLSGQHQVIAKNLSGCTDTINVAIECETIKEVYVSAVQGLLGQYCLQLEGNKSDYSFNYLDAETEPYLSAGPVHQGCINFDALLPGTASLLVEFCHKPTNTCDKIRILIEVFSKENVKPPSAVHDLYPVAYNGQRMLDVLLNDEIVGSVISVTVDEAVTTGDVRVDALNRLHYRAPADWCGNDRILYEVCNSGGCDTASVTIQVTCEDLLVFNGFSPNGDGSNDYFLVLGIEKYPNNKLMIFNSNGHEVYSRSTYMNDWDGTYLGTPLLDGTYFYVLTVEGQEPASGYVQIRR